MQIDELRSYINSKKTDAELEAKLEAIELAIRKYTNNGFRNIAYRRTADIVGGIFVTDALVPYEVGDTLQITTPGLNFEKLVTVTSVDDSIFTVDKKVYDESNLLISKVEYPADIKMGAIEMLKYDLDKREKQGIQSESLSRYSVTYAQQTEDNTSIGYPKSVVSFLKPYCRGRH